MTKQTVLEHFEETVSNAKERLKKLIESAGKYGLDTFVAGLATAVEILEEEEVEKLEKMFQMQQALDERIIAECNIEKTLDEWVVAITIAMESEIDEIRREVNWKWWKQEKEIDLNRLQEEVIDLWHFLLSLSRMVGLAPETIFEKYMDKNKINHQRQEQGY
ncbi:dimeric dUTPase (all-alpha-NTP-PPase superfamily) [Anoxybacillus tengchongensis]|uniref:Dimeric dUTPase (All-alpha-NTP-PPase superfamily) n=1 Tax=Anoxybacillus tengchongensis TaxID=576944 RepID=A0A7W9YQK9_9BACL|nr:dUTPase [Anoxybacillus tengchongensis]MBB6176400.1 dimeric dUTPase (all-alpha-NTP-PPase superfamily) [Anoxybacillus tengchongensis]